jgi:hypothetical protein
MVIVGEKPPELRNVYTVQEDSLVTVAPLVRICMNGCQHPSLESTGLT